MYQVFHKVLIPPSVNSEIEALQEFKIDLTSFLSSDWIEIKSPSNLEEVKKYMVDLDEGESEAISLAKEFSADFLLIDERAGTNKALEEGLTTIGLVGVLMKSKELGFIEKIEPILYQLKEEAGFWLGKKLLDSVLKEAGER
ncbi:MAG: DUF3368 domain-containing protein [Lewinellaceae bacterium]|nr:DUF3368 domain-containing protein [Lewinellaceae bacterium]MCB9290560.1 DUF3368 domain-containing protein [Lewinellaceae bacterium]